MDNEVKLVDQQLAISKAAEAKLVAKQEIEHKEWLTKVNKAKAIPDKVKKKPMEQLYPISKAAEMIGVSVSTLRKWDADGILKPSHKVGKHRRYTEEQIKNCNKNFDPVTVVCALTKKDTDLIQKYAQTQSKEKIQLVDRIKYQYESVCISFMRAANILHRKNCDDLTTELGFRPNLILVSPDIAVMLTTHAAWMKYNKGDKDIAFVGTPNSAWMIYDCAYLGEGKALMGRTVDGTVDMVFNSWASIDFEKVVMV